ncbi:hypothetical protein [uncultured Hoeflea sp.]|uniref:hypothetical protein n=1 Tax=uncultured Hoeflea sp. TaxID=538666 RepID=UPI0030DA1A65|tara:strand:- start:4594 stop:5040 length:447 start_codon:yes stop_codon:yes gene_type:complete
MTTTLTAYLIDPEACLIRPTEMQSLNNSLIADVIDCDAADFLMFDTVHSLYFDDTGLRNGLTHYMMLQGHADPLAGKMLLVRNAGPQPAISMQEVAARISLFKPVLDPVIVTKCIEHDDVSYHVSAVEEFKPRLELFVLTIEDYSMAD